MDDIQPCGLCNEDVPALLNQLRDRQFDRAVYFGNNPSEMAKVVSRLAPVIGFLTTAGAVFLVMRSRWQFHGMPASLHLLPLGIAVTALSIPVSPVVAGVLHMSSIKTWEWSVLNYARQPIDKWLVTKATLEQLTAIVDDQGLKELCSSLNPIQSQMMTRILSPDKLQTVHHRLALPQNEKATDC